MCGIAGIHYENDFSYIDVKIAVAGSVAYQTLEDIATGVDKATDPTKSPIPWLIGIGIALYVVTSYWKRAK